MMEEIGTVPMGVALLAAFTLILGASALIVWDHLRGRMRGWPRVMGVVVGAAACALGATVISVGVGWGAAVTLDPDEPSPVRTKQTTPESQERTSPTEGRGSETSPERSASSTATASPKVTASPTTPSASPTTPSATPTATPSPTASPTATGSPSP